MDAGFVARGPNLDELLVFFARLEHDDDLLSGLGQPGAAHAADDLAAALGRVDLFSTGRLVFLPALRCRQVKY